MIRPFPTYQQLQHNKIQVRNGKRHQPCYHKKLQGFTSFTQQPEFVLLQCLRKLTRQYSESTGRTNSQMITNCGLMPFQDIRAETAPYWGYGKHDRRLHLHHVGHADVLFLSTQLTESNGHCGPKIQTDGSSCRSQNERGLGKCIAPFVCQGEALEEENTSQNITTHCDTCTLAVDTLRLHAASTRI